MVLVQFLLTQDNNDKDFVVPVSGKCSIRVLKVDFWDDDNTHHCEVVKIESDVLYFPYSPQRYITFLSHPSHVSTVDSGFKEYNIYATIPGRIHLKVTDNAGLFLVPDFFCVLTLELEQLNRDFDVEA